MNLTQITRSKPYILFVILVIMPIDGILIERGNVLLGLMLISSQIPWLFSLLERINNNE